MKVASCCGGVVTHFPIVIPGATTEGILALLTAVSYGITIGLADNREILPVLYDYFNHPLTPLHEFDLHTPEEVTDDPQVSLLQDEIERIDYPRIRMGLAEYTYNYLLQRVYAGSVVLSDKLRDPARVIQLLEHPGRPHENRVASGIEAGRTLAHVILKRVPR